MKDARGHGSNPRGAVALHPNTIKAFLSKPSVTVKPTTGAQPKSGIMVSRPGSMVLRGGRVSEDDMRAFANRNAAAIRDGAHLGKWTDPATGLIHLDVSDNVKSKAAAIKLGRQRNQIAVYDVAHKRTIRTYGTGG